MSSVNVYSPLTNPLNHFLLLPIIYLLSLLIFPPLPTSPTNSKTLPSIYDPDVYNWLPDRHPVVMVWRRYTAKGMSVFDGKDGGRILLSILKVGRDGKVPVDGKKGERTVFDVSSGRGFYGPGMLSIQAVIEQEKEGGTDGVM